MNETGTDIQGMAEINKPWNAQTKLLYQTQLDLLYNYTQVTYSSAPADHDSTYQPGGTLFNVDGSAAGMAQISGNDDMGRFCWHTLHGKHDGGVILITAYRVCHVASDNPGPLTTYTQQCVAIREAGILHPNPRR